MSSLPDVLDQVQNNITVQVTEFAVKTLKENSAQILKELTDDYATFFETLHDEVLNDPVSSKFGGSPKIFKQIGAPIWSAVDTRWWQQKESAVNRGASKSILDMYKGLTFALAGRARPKRKRNKDGGRRKSRPTQSFDAYIQTLANGGLKQVESFFGPMKVAYSITRPDRGKVDLSQLNSVVTEVKRTRNNKGHFASFLDGTVITVSISAFGNIDNISEKALLDLIISKGGNAKQWVKVGGGDADGHIRAILTPLIKYYTDVYFSQTIKANLS